MANNTPVSAPIEALLEQLGAAITGAMPAPTPAALYAQLLRIRDEAVLVEVRASARDRQVSDLLAELATAADRLERMDTPPAVTTLATIAARHCGTTAAAQDAALQRRWDTINRAYLAGCDAAGATASQGDAP